MVSGSVAEIEREGMAVWPSPYSYTLK